MRPRRDSRLGALLALVARMAHAVVVTGGLGRPPRYHRPLPRRGCQSRVRQGAGRTAPYNQRAPLGVLMLRGGVVALGSLLVVLLTATTASAQTADLAITNLADSPDP